MQKKREEHDRIEKERREEEQRATYINWLVERFRPCQFHLVTLHYVVYPFKSKVGYVISTV